MSIPQSAIDDILARVDIVDVIRTRVALKRAGREWQACCPFHNEKTPSFTVSPKKQFYYCFGCHASGNALKFLMEFEHQPFRDALETLASMAGVALPEDKPQDHAAARQRDEERSALDLAQTRFKQALPGSPAAAYLQKRGIDTRMVEAFGLGYAADRGSLASISAESGERAGLLLTRDDGSRYERFRNRLMFPIRDTRGRIVGFGGRTLVDDKAKYLNSPETPLFHKGRMLYGLYEARQARRDLPGFVIVEGYLDVISLAQYGIDYAVATLGTAATEHHLEQLLRIHPRLTFCFDGDRAGRRAAAHALEVALPLLRDGHQIHFLFLPDGHDPDTLVREIGPDRFEQLIADAQPLSRYLLQTLAEGLNLSQIEGRASFSEKAKAALQQIKAPAFKAGLVRELEKASNLPSTALGSSANETGEPEYPRPRKRARHTAGPARAYSRIQRAFMLLLTWPELAELADDVESIAGLPDAGAELLSRMLDTLHAEPHLHFGALLNRIADEKEAAALQRLAREDPEISEADAREEFAGILAGMNQSDPRQRMQELSARARHGKLSEPERVELSSLLEKISSSHPST